MDDLDKPTESSEERAKRMWSNYALTKSFLEEQAKAQRAPPSPKTEPNIAELIKTERPKADTVTKFQNRFVKDFKSMIAEHKRRNVALYRLSLLTQIRRLRRAKLKRLLALQAEREAAQLELAQKQAQPKARDLFA